MENYRRESCPTPRRSASRTLARAFSRTAHTAVLEPLEENRPFTRLRGGRACTRTQRRRRTALTMQSARYAWRSLLPGWPWPDWSASAASTRRAYRPGSSTTRADAPSISTTGLGSSAPWFSAVVVDGRGLRFVESTRTALGLLWATRKRVRRRAGKRMIPTVWGCRPLHEPNREWGPDYTLPSYLHRLRGVEVKTKCFGPRGES